LENARVARHYELDRYCYELAAASFGLEEYDVIHTQDIFTARALARVKPPRAAHIAHLHGSVAIELMMHFGARPELGITEGTPDWRYMKAIEHYGAISGDVTVTANEWQKRLLATRFGVP